MPIRPTGARALTPRGSGSVSSTSAARFAARVRRRRQRRSVIAGAAVAAGLVVGWLVFASPLLAVQRIEVHGAQRVPVARIQALAASQLGRSMAVASPQALADQLIGIPLIRSARVTRSWPTTLQVTVVERQPVAAVRAGSQVHLVDEDGVVVDSAAAPPAGTPLLDVDLPRAGAATLRAARQVWAQWPVALRGQVKSITATSPDAVAATLTDGSSVVWGSAQDGDRKVALLQALHPRATAHPVTVDVSAPDAPAVTAPKP